MDDISSASKADGPELDLISKQIQAYEAEISGHNARTTALEHKICDLKSSRNARTASGRLPPKVLAKIFLHILNEWIGFQPLIPNADGEDDDYERDWSSVPSFRWISVSRVCRAWRQVASSTPQLWATLKPSSPAFVAMALERSGSFPLDVLGSQADQAAVSSFKQILQHIDRIRTLRVWGGPPIQDVFYEDSGWNDLSAPLLKELHLVAGTGYEAIDTWNIFETMNLPQLSDVTLCRGSPDVTRYLAASPVTHLNLMHFEDISLGPVLEAIGCFPALTNLTMYKVSECAYLGIFHLRNPGPPIPADGLRFLDYLSIDNIHLSSATAILSHLPIPTHTSVNLRGDEEVDPTLASTMAGDLEDRVFRSLLSDDTAAVRPHVQSFELSCVQLGWGGRFRQTDNTNFKLRTWTCEASGEQLSCDDSRATTLKERLRFDFEARVTHGVVDILVSRLLVRSDLRNVDSVVIECNAAVIKRPLWQMLFTAMPHLRFLHLRADAARTFVDFHDPPSASASPGLLYPSLEHLRLSHTKFATSRNRPRAGDLFPRFLAALETLAKQGLRLRKLELERPINLEDGALDKLAYTDCAQMVQISGDDKGRNT